mmetsp:Transcript_110353/g.293109  ORF Transcript_110353/g.293109 Transcript_110353/m.293109 type:complete len:225 (+) Transcript_110353:361-1035(+)
MLHAPDKVVADEYQQVLDGQLDEKVEDWEEPEAQVAKPSNHNGHEEVVHRDEAERNQDLVGCDHVNGLDLHARTRQGLLPLVLGQICGQGGNGEEDDHGGHGKGHQDQRLQKRGEGATREVPAALAAAHIAVPHARGTQHAVVLLDALDGLLHAAVVLQGLGGTRESLRQLERLLRTELVVPGLVQRLHGDQRLQLLVVGGRWHHGIQRILHAGHELGHCPSLV